MSSLKTFFILINHKTLLIAIAIGFPVVFSIGGAYKRREEALDDYASLAERPGLG